jgi:hypothetical protein
VVGRDAVQPGAELAFALERAEAGDRLDQHFLGDFLSVLGLEDHAQGDVVDPRLVPQDQRLQRLATTVPCLPDKLAVVRVACDFREGIEHDRFLA